MLNDILTTYNFSEVIFDTVLFAILAIAFGYIIDVIIPFPKQNESAIKCILLVMLQIIISGVFLFLISKLYENSVHRDPDLYYGVSMFIVLFFLVQGQLIKRLQTIYQYGTGVNIV